jgi:hypothetical protein
MNKNTSLETEKDNLLDVILANTTITLNFLDKFNFFIAFAFSGFQRKIDDSFLAIFTIHSNNKKIYMHRILLMYIEFQNHFEKGSNLF